MVLESPDGSESCVFSLLSPVVLSTLAARNCRRLQRDWWPNRVLSRVRYQSWTSGCGEVEVKGASGRSDLCASVGRIEDRYNLPGDKVLSTWNAKGEVRWVVVRLQVWLSARVEQVTGLWVQGRRPRMAGLIGTGADTEGRRAQERARHHHHHHGPKRRHFQLHPSHCLCLYYYAPLGSHQSIEPHAAAASCCLYLRSTSPHPAQYLTHSSTTNNHPTTGTTHHVVLWIRQQPAT